MMDAQTQALLQAVLRRASLSLLQYGGQAFPWAGADEREALAQLRQVVEEDRCGTTELGRYLARKRIMPAYIGSYPTAFTSMGFVSLRFLVPKLVAAQRQEIANLERDLAAVQDPEAREQLQKLLDLKRRHLPVLEGLHAPQPIKT
jgi:hypothetical protein